MWLLLINPLKLCSYGSWSLEGYVCKSSCCQCHILLLGYSNVLNFIRPFYWLMTLPQPLSHSAALPEWLMQPLSHSARVAGAATQPLCQSGWRSHSATLPEWLEQPLSHSAILPQSLPEWLEQPLSHSARVAGAATQPLSHQSGWVAEWLMWKFPPLRVQSYIILYYIILYYVILDYIILYIYYIILYI